METFYADIAARTGGNIYIGVVGPVRTGKSTLIKRIMEQMVIPNIPDPYRRERAKDELPQSGSGRTIMTSEPKFVPEEAVEISPDGTAKMRIRMIDSVGYMVDGAVGAEENGVPRMVTTPWYDHEIPMTEAAELGTRKVMEGHCSIGLVVTTDGTITDIPRTDYMAAERRAICDMQATGKPYLVLVNTRQPGGEAAGAAADYLRREFSVEPVVADCQALDEAGIQNLIRAADHVGDVQRLATHGTHRPEEHETPTVRRLNPLLPVRPQHPRPGRDHARGAHCLERCRAYRARRDVPDTQPRRQRGADARQPVIVHPRNTAFPDRLRGCGFAREVIAPHTANVAATTGEIFDPDNARPHPHKPSVPIARLRATDTANANCG